MQQREAMQLKVMELNLNTLAAIAKAKGTTLEEFKVATEFMKAKFKEGALQDYFQSNPARYNAVFNQILDDVRAGRLTTDSSLGDIGERVTTAPGEKKVKPPLSSFQN